MDSLNGEKEEMDTEARPPMLHFQYDQWCDLLGGALWKEAYERWALTGREPDREGSHGEAWFSSARQFLFQDESLYPLEILWLKWNMVTALCAQVHAFHKKYQRPFLDLQPTQIGVIALGGINPFLPVRWSFTIKALNAADATLPYPSDSIPQEMRSHLYHPPADIQNVYVCPLMRESPLGTEQTVTALIRTSELIRTQDTAEGVCAIMEVQLTSESLRASEYSESDVFQVHLNLPGRDRLIRLWASKTASLEKGLLLKGVTDSMSPAVWEEVQKSHHHVFPKSTVSVYKTYHIPCDLYSLGMILFRTLLVHDEQDMSDLYGAIQNIVQGLEPMVQGLLASDHKVLSDRLQAKLREEGKLFAKSSVLYRHEDRERGADFLPGAIWSSALLLAFRMVSGVPGFSYCSNHGDYERESPHRRIEKVETEMNRLGLWMRAELFGARQRNREMLEIFYKVRQEV